jgi:hypothetical protein
MSQELTITENDISPVEEKINNLSITDKESLTDATELLSQANRYLDSVVEWKEKKTKPLNQALRVIRLETKPLETKLESIIASIRGKMGSYQAQVIKDRLEAEKKIADRIGEGKGKLKLDTAINKIGQLEEVENKVEAEAGSVTFVEQQQFEIMDTTMIPNEYMLPNEPKIRLAMKAGIKVAGVRYFTVQVPRNSR